MRVAPKAQAAEFAANILPIIRMTGIGPVAVRCPRVPDRVDEGSDRIRFSSAILPPYARRSKSLEVLIPILYLQGVSTGDFDEALIALLGNDAGGLSASTVGRSAKIQKCGNVSPRARARTASESPEHASGRSRVCRLSQN
jgi:hypothetical protein